MLIVAEIVEGSLPRDSMELESFPPCVRTVVGSDDVDKDDDASKPVRLSLASQIGSPVLIAVFLASTT